MPNLSQSGNNGIQLNDGIKGFSDEIVEQLVPQPEEEDDDEHDGLIMKKPSTAFNKEAADTFDNSYNNSTEQSIMNLLKSASQSNLDQIESKEINETTTSISKPTLQDIKVKDESEDDIHIKEEDEDEQKLIKQEQDQDEDVSLEEIKQEESSIFTAKFETVSDVGRSSNSPRLVSPSSMTPIIRPLIDQIETPTNETDEDSELSSRDSTKMSIRFHMDSQWKLEDSQDGDKEDNDENGFTTTINDISQAPSEDKEIQLNQPILNVDLSPNVSATSQPFEDASDDLISKTLAPSRIEDEEQQQEEVEQEQPQDSQHEHTEENVLANSSNIAPPEELTLPPVETHNYSSFDEITRNVGSDKDSFEESLSAEHESDKKASDFLSIWHLQERQKKNPRTGEFFKVLDNKETIITPESQSHTIQPQVPKIPLSLQQKKFKEVNVITRKVVNPEFEELQVSGFLPELSEDSGFENHFNFLRNTSNNNYSNMANNRRSFSPLSTKNVLSNIDNDPNVIEPPAPNSNTNSSTNAHTNSIKRKFLRNSISVISATASIQHQPTVFKSLQPLSNDNINNRSSSIPKSKFKVPSFEIKRSNSVLSPRDFYNDDIFADTIVKKPTIKSSGMKTLPSMDREDVKRILSTKRVITQDEYAKVKLRGLNIKKNSIVNEPNDKYDELQQQASIHNVSPESSPSLKFAILPHLAGELLQAPNALLSKDQFFKDYQIFNNGNKTGGIQQPSVDLAFPEPDPELINSPNSNIFKTPPKADIDLNVDDTIDDVQLQKHLLPNESPINIQLPTTPKKSPIKIGSPMKLVKQGDKVTGAIIPASPKKTHKPQVSFSGDEIINSKLRGENSPRKDSIAEENDDEQHKPSTVSVPSAFTNSSRPSGTSSATLLNFGGNHEYRTLKEEQQQLDHSQDESNIDINPDVNDVQETEPKELQFTERGKLFFRVIGLKNINLPDLDKHNAELSITLDNGVHCIKTPNYKLESNNVLIGKEFELTVGESLAFILTMKMNYEKPRGGLKEVHERKVVKSKNKLGRMFGSKDIVTVTKFVPFEVKDSWEHKFAQDGSFGRCYIDLEQFEDKITGKALNFNLNCFNEWDKYIDPTTKELTKGKAYRIGQLEVKMLFVPRVDAREVLPTSIKSAYEGVHELGQEFNLTHEGYLHQEGGDCEIWKKRFFKLYGTSLIAHSEFSHKTRAKINLAKIVEVIYVDKENIKNSSTNYRNFSDVLLVEHAFKIRFANGEIIDFGAPNKSEKMQWISIFEKITHRNKFRRQPWVKLMLQEAGYVNAPQQLQQEDQKPQNEVISSRSSMIL
ncbi:hypothetical protein DFJ63DRAFT_319830 [Scheffersomyces coipomensis]|uniref:uncharacterized protein n=1 Tax=Scheffersomyces coipomensis TaxID=1788519 RepID=UPI00315D086D